MLLNDRLNVARVIEKVEGKEINKINSFHPFFRVEPSTSHTLANSRDFLNLVNIFSLVFLKQNVCLAHASKQALSKKKKKKTTTKMGERINLVPGDEGGQNNQGRATSNNGYSC